MTTKLKCLLLDDELAALSYLKLLCEQIPGVEVVKAFNDPLLFLEAARQPDINTCILDIQMPGMSGLEVARQLKDKLIIFTTAHKEFAAEAFDLNAVDYVRKPLQKERLGQAFGRAFLRLENTAIPEKSQALWNTDKGKTLLAFDDILYITSSETDSRDKLVSLSNGGKTVFKNMRFEQILGILPAGKFCRINKKEIIALQVVRHFNADRIHLSMPLRENKAGSLYLSDVYREEFRRKIGQL